MHCFLKQFESSSHAATQSGDNPKPVEQANGLLKPHLQIVPSASYLRANSKKTLGSIYHVLIYIGKVFNYIFIDNDNLEYYMDQAKIN